LSGNSCICCCCQTKHRSAEGEPWIIAWLVVVSSDVGLEASHQVWSILCTEPT
jgi:hypothetical protein